MRQALRQRPSCLSIVEGSTSGKSTSSSSASMLSPVPISAARFARAGRERAGSADSLRAVLRPAGRCPLKLPHNHSLHRTRPRRRATRTFVGRAGELRIR
jgi:hypothetical protein